RASVRRARIGAHRPAVRPPRASAEAAAVPGPGVVRAGLDRDARARLRFRLRLDGVVDDHAEVHDGDLEDHHQEHDLPDRVRRHRDRVYPGLGPAELRGWELYAPGTLTAAARARRGAGLREHLRARGADRRARLRLRGAPGAVRAARAARN